MKRIAPLLASLLAALLGTTSVGAPDARADDSLSIKPEVFIDGYFAHDFDDPPTRKRSYFTQAFYDDEIALNLGHAGVTVAGDRLRGRFIGQYGSSVISNYAAEPNDFWRYVQEGYVGVKLADDLWLDTGVFLAHIGAESWLSKDNFNYTRSYIAEFSPYYESGGRLDWKVSDSLNVQFLLLRGWQNISDDRDLAYGTQVKWTPADDVTFVHNTFFGRENRGDREFNDFVLTVVPLEDLSIIGSVDVGQQELTAPGGGSAWWWGYSVMAQYRVTSSVAAGFRVEQYNDPHQAIVATGGPSFRANGVSANIDVRLAEGLTWRNEVRGFLGHDRIFPNGEGSSRDGVLAVTSLSYFFS